MTISKKMVIPKAQLTAYKAFFKGKSLYAEAKKIGMDARTLQSLLKTGKTQHAVTLKINTHILAETKKINDLTTIINPTPTQKPIISNDNN